MPILLIWKSCKRPPPSPSPTRYLLCRGERIGEVNPAEGHVPPLRYPALAGHRAHRYQTNPYEEYLYRYIDIGWTNGPVPGSFFASQIFQDFARFLDEWPRPTREYWNISEAALSSPSLTASPHRLLRGTLQDQGPLFAGRAGNGPFTPQPDQAAEDHQKMSGPVTPSLSSPPTRPSSWLIPAPLFTALTTYRSDR